jgi:hypothetical protein
MVVRSRSRSGRASQWIGKNLGIGLTPGYQ